MRVFIGFLVVAAFAFPVRGQNEFFGRVLDQVTCQADSSQSYALYVPSRYTPEKKWPVIFCFDPSARGKIPVERLQAAAEKYGYLIAGSLNSRNGPYAANAVATQAMVKDVSAHFSLDAQRIYTAGMSGGARVATALGLSGLAKGVIACGAGFPLLPDGVPRKIPFVFFGAAGSEDFNYTELKRLDGELDDRKAVHRIVFFNGGHEWAPVEVFNEAVEWFELAAMRTGTRARDEALVSDAFRSRVARLAPSPALERWRGLQALVADFEGLAETGDLAKEAVALGESSEVRAAVKAERALTLREDELVARLGNEAFESWARKQKLAGQLRQKADAPEDSPERRMVRRVIASFSSMTRETVRGLFEEAEYEKAAGLLEMAVALRPGQTRTLYDLARARARLGDKKRALDSLREATAAGFDDALRVEAEPAFTKLHDDADFKALLVKMREEPAESTLELPAMRVSALLASVELRLFYLPNPGTDTPPLSFLRVEAVRATSAAARAGVERGMEITAIQGLRIRGLTEKELNEAMTLPVKNEIVLTVRDMAGGNEREIRIAVGKPTGVRENVSVGPESADEFVEC